MTGVHILVTTPSSLLRLMLSLRTVNLRRCCHLVFDDADITFDAYDEEVARIVGMYLDAHRQNTEMLDQVGNCCVFL